MWQRFTEDARRVVFLAQEEAGKRGESHVSTEHLLLAILRLDSSKALQALRAMHADPAKIRAMVEDQMEKRESGLAEDMQLTPRAKRVIDLAYSEARRMMNDFIGSEHILLGLVCEAEGIAGRILSSLGIDLQKTRDVVADLQRGAEVMSGNEKTTGHARTMAGKDLIGIADIERADIDAIFATCKRLKCEIAPEQQRGILAGKTLAMIFEKPSLRTRVSFEAGMTQLGGHAIYLAPSDIQLGKRESIGDAARTLDRMCDLIMARTFAHSTVEELAKHSKVPVINGLSDLEHPCQALADFFTILEKKGKLEGIKVAFVGDGNNVAHSLMLVAAKMGADFTIACPENYEPSEEIVRRAREDASKTGAKIEIVRDPKEAVSGADVVYTDVWASMGQEHEAEEREKAFASYQVNAQLMGLAKPDAIFMHCLPAHRGSEVTDDVIDSPQSVVFDEAENRLHVQKAIMVLVAGGAA
jgi:ornithine carbamoyltransferase